MKMTYKLIKTDELKIGDTTRTLRLKDAKVVFIRWYENHPQNMGYIVAEGENYQRELVVIYGGEHIGVQTEI